MGNYLARATSRQTVCKLLEKLPDWFFGPLRRIAVSTAVLKLREECANSSDDWDSVLNLSLDSCQDGDSSETVSSCSKRSRRSRRASCCCHGPESNRQLENLQDELRLLREHITILLRRENFKTVEVETPPKSIPAPPPTKSFYIPTPPPLPGVGSGAEEKKAMHRIDWQQKESKPDVTNVLREITNVKLRPVSRSRVKTQPKSDIRNDLYDILKRRYAAIHSPDIRRGQKHSNSSDSDDF